MKLNVFALLLSGVCLSGLRQTPAPGDLWQWRTASDPRITSDGNQVGYIEEWNERSRNSIYANLKLLAVNGRASRAFTGGLWHDRSPRWSPDNSRIAWISDREGPQRIWIAAAAGGNEKPITRSNNSPDALAWAPEGDLIAFLSAAQIWLVSTKDGEPRQLTAGELEYRGEPAWMPDGQNLICVEKGGELVVIRASDGVVRQLTHAGRMHADPVPSPDGTKIAYTEWDARPFYSVRRLWTMNPDGSRVRQLAGTLDRDVRDPQWSNDSRTIYFLADDRGSTHVYLARNDGSVRQLTERTERMDGFTLADNGRAVMVRSSATEGSALFTFLTDAPAGGWTITDVNGELLANRNWGSVEAMNFESAGKTMQAWLVKPFGFDAGQKYPLLVESEDTPPRLLGAEFALRAQVFGARGFVVLRVNPRGTPGFGEEFGDLLATEVAAAPADDLLRAIDAVMSKGYIDSKRIFVSAGISAAWLLGHTDRFAAIVARRPISDWATFADARRWLNDPALYERRSPLSYAGNFHTRTLIIAGDPDGQSDQLWSALEKRSGGSSLMREVNSPSCRVAALEAELAFLLREPEKRHN